MNVLLTCAGRRTYLVRYFQEALRGRGEALARDSSASAPAIIEADRGLPLAEGTPAEPVSVALSFANRLPQEPRPS